MEDITRRLRIDPAPDSVERERYMAANMFGDFIREHKERKISRAEMERFASQSIEAACVFWEAWDIAVLTPDLAIADDAREDEPMAGLS